MPSTQLMNLALVQSTDTPVPVSVRWIAPIAPQASALLNGRDYVTPDDVKAMFMPVCAHRVISKTYLHNGDSNATERVLQAILDRTATPR